MELTKKQVKELIKTLKFHEGTRKALEVLYFKDGFAYATDGYIAIRLDTQLVAQNGHDDAVIHYSELEKWCKSAKPKDTLTDLDLKKMPRWEGWNEEGYGYPLIEKIIPKESLQPIERIRINPDFLLRASTILGIDMPILEFRGNFKPVVMRDGVNLALVMPCTIEE